MIGLLGPFQPTGHHTHLCTKAIRSAARPDPSHTTTGTGGVSVTYSRTARIVFMPPSITRQTTGVLEWVTGMIHKDKWNNVSGTVIQGVINIVSNGAS